MSSKRTGRAWAGKSLSDFETPPQPQGSCTSAAGNGKRAYYSRAQAREAVRHARQISGHDVRVYRCPDCNLLHIGHSRRGE